MKRKKIKTYPTSINTGTNKEERKAFIQSNLLNNDWLKSLIYNYNNLVGSGLLMCDAPKLEGPYTQIPCCDILKFGGPADNSTTRGIFVVAFLYIFLTNIQILIIFYKSLMYDSFTLLNAKIY